MALEERGERPDRADRGAVAALIWRELDRRWRLAEPMVAHQMMYGVPVGPTLSMVHPPVLRGSAGLEP